MGVYIPKMKKPKCCGVCLLCLDDSRIANGYCMIFHRHVNMTELDEKCPLIEVTEPHGDLIDVNKLRKEHNIWIGEGIAPTVIEAEGE